MAGCAIALQRLLRLRPALISTVTSKEFVDLKICPGMTKLLKSERMWNDMTIAVRAIFPALIILRLADKTQPCIDKLYFYVRRMEASLQRSKELLDPLQKHYKGRAVSDNLSAAMLSYFLQVNEDEAYFGVEFMTANDDPDDISDDGSESLDVDFDAGPDDDDDNDNNDPVLDPNIFTLGDVVIDLWNHRKKKLETDLSITAWMVSPHAEIMEDVNKNHTGHHRDAVERILKKWSGLDIDKDKADLGKLINTFWEEFEQFHTKTGEFYDRDHIWNSSDVMEGNSHLWHKKYTYRHTTIFGKMACRVCSKIMGIGSAERSWGDVKHLKTNKRSHLSAAKVDKQATIFGASCMFRASVNKKIIDEDDALPYKFWTDEDFDKEFDMFENGTDRSDRPPRPVRIFKSWKEDWEQEAILTRDPVNEARLLEKYGGLQWYDYDFKLLCTSKSDELAWTRRRGTGGGFCVIVYNENYNKDDNDNAKNIERWEIMDDLRYSIKQYYTKNKQLGVMVINLEPVDGELNAENSEPNAEENNESQLH